MPEEGTQPTQGQGDSGEQVTKKQGDQGTILDNQQQSSQDAGGGNEGWFAGLPDDLKNNPTVQKYDSQEDALRAHLSLVQKLGNEKIPLPKDENDDAGWDEVYKRLGMPDDGQYEFEKIEVPEELGEQNLDAFADKAKDLRLTQKQAEGLYEWYTKNAIDGYSQQQKQIEEARNNAMNDLRKEYGAKLDENIKKSNQAFVELFGEEGADKLKNIVGNDPNFVRGMVKVANMMSEDGIGQFRKSSFTKTPNEAKMELDAIFSNPHDPYWGEKTKDGTPIPLEQHRERVKYVESLQQMVAQGE